MLDVCDPRVIRALLEKYGFHFSKAKGQNFLTQRWVPQRIAQEAGIDRSTGVLEIGPGFGPLTQELCLRAGRVTAIELDTTLRPVLAETVGESDNLTIHFARRHENGPSGPCAGGIPRPDARRLCQPAVLYHVSGPDAPAGEPLLLRRDRHGAEGGRAPHLRRARNGGLLRVLHPLPVPRRAGAAV